jgi:hypothetical protein
LATNFHVAFDITTTLKYGTTTDTQGTQINAITGYKNFSDFTPVEDQRYSKFAEITNKTPPQVTGNPGNDMVVINVDFGDSPSASIKPKLDKLNDE